MGGSESFRVHDLAAGCGTAPFFETVPGSTSLLNHAGRRRGGGHRRSGAAAGAGSCYEEQRHKKDSFHGRLYYTRRTRLRIGLAG